jgi:hypothetical protein
MAAVFIALSSGQLFEPAHIAGDFGQGVAVLLGHLCHLFDVLGDRRARGAAPRRPG